MTLVEQPATDVAIDLDEPSARALVNKVRQHMALTTQAAIKLYKGRGWLALGYDSWDACCVAEFDGQRPALQREQRREAVAEMSEAGMSTRAISAATGASVGTVHGDQVFNSEHLTTTAAGVANATPADAPDPEWQHLTASPVEPAQDDEFAMADTATTDPDDEIVDAEVIDDPAPRTVTGVDGKSYPKPTPKPQTPAEKAAADDLDEARRYARNIEKVLSSWPYVLSASTHPLRSQIVEQLTEDDRHHLSLIEGAIHGR